MLAAAGVAVLGAAAVLGPWSQAPRLPGAPGAEATGDAAPGAAAPATPGEPASVAIVTYDPDRGDQAVAVQVLVVHPAAGTATSLLVPAATLADVPGAGSFPLAEAYAFGGGRSVRVTLDNLLGVRLDGIATLPVAGWGELADALDGVEVDLPAPARVAAADGGGTLPAGRHHLDGTEVAAFLALDGDAGGQLDRLPRTQQVFDGLLDELADDPDALARVLDADGPWRTTDGTPLAALLEQLAVVRAADGLTAVTLPVTAIGIAGDERYRVDAERAASLLTERFGATVTTAATTGGDVQVLNGNGVPGIGQRVAERLRDGDHRIVLSGNADSFEHATTRIVLHDDDAHAMTLAEDLRARLGVGEVELAAARHSVVEVTVVVGADFPPAQD